MGVLKEEKNDFDISALLAEAAEENDRARALQEKRAAEEERLTKTIVVPSEGCTSPGGELSEKPRRNGCGNHRAD